MDSSILTLHSQHPTIPDSSLTAPITHVFMAFMTCNTFNREEGHSDWPLFMTVEETRAHFAPGTKVLVAIGGWGDTAGFSHAAATQEGRRTWARNVAAMIRDTGADGRSSLYAENSPLPAVK